MAENVTHPFDTDIEDHGGYLYTSCAIRSAAYANRRFSNVIISSLDFTGKRVVDVGCGDGTYTAVLCEESRPAMVLGIDPAARAIQRAESLFGGRFGNLRFRRGFAADLVHEGECFDIAVYRGVVHHVGDPSAEIAAAMKLAKQVFFLEPNGWNPVVKLLERVSPYHRRHEERSYRLGRYRRWIEASGGIVDRAFFFGLVPVFCPGWMVSVGSFLEPFVEKVPGVRMLSCGQVGIVATSARRKSSEQVENKA